MIQLSDRVMKLKPSSTLAVTARARALKAEGVDVVSFGAGEPDFGTPEHISAAAWEALQAGCTRYEDTAGTPEARRAVARYMKTRHGLEVTAQNVILSTGAKHALYLAFMAIMNPGDELILPSPYWVSYPAHAALAGASCRVVPGSVDREFKITPRQLEEALTERSRVLMLCSPSNPAGTTYTRAELQALAEVVLRHPRLLVFSDEIYERLVYGEEPFTCFASLGPEVAARTVVFNGVSKAYAMTGWRVGYAVGPTEVISAMAKLQGQMTSNITSFTMPAVVTALEGPQEPVERMVAEFARRAEHIHRRMSAIPGVKCPRPTGAFYIFPDISQAVFGRRDPAGQILDTAQAFATSLLEHARVAVVPGEDFGAPDHVRLSFATSMEQIDKGMDRITEFMARLQADSPVPAGNP
ncbi:MAG: pyridoxal phosphate-dependent aminotransferase [Candidatus Xenobium sp.]|jgi:aspartate aminotransferase